MKTRCAETFFYRYFCVFLVCLFICLYLFLHVVQCSYLCTIVHLWIYRAWVFFSSSILTYECAIFFCSLLFITQPVKIVCLFSLLLLFEFDEKKMILFLLHLFCSVLVLNGKCSRYLMQCYAINNGACSICTEQLVSAYGAFDIQPNEMWKKEEKKKIKGANVDDDDKKRNDFVCVCGLFIYELLRTNRKYK